MHRERCDKTNTFCQRLERAILQAMKRLLVLLAFAMLPAHGNDLLSQWITDHWNRENGLPQQTITSVVRSPDGYLWLASRAGLLRFDGLRATPFDRSRINGLGTNIVVRLQADGTGRLWAAPLEAGLLFYEAGKWQRIGTEAGLPAREIAELHVARDGSLLAAPLNGGLLRWDGQRFVAVSTPGPLPASTVLRVLHASDGATWLGTAKHGLIRWQGAEWMTFGKEHGLPALGIWGLVERQPGQIQVGISKGVWSLHGLRFVQQDVPAALRSLTIEQSLRVSADEVWWGTFKDGLWRCRGNVAEQVSLPGARINIEIRSLYPDPDTSLWVGSEAGLFRIHPPLLRFYGEAENYRPNSSMRGIVTASGDLIHARADGSLYRGVGSNAQLWARHPERDPDQNLIGQTLDGAVVAVDSNNSLFFVRDGKYQRQQVSGEASRIVDTKKYGLLLGLRNGQLLQRSPSGWKPFEPAMPITGANTTQMLEAEDGSLHVGTRSGYAVLRNGKWKSWTKRDGLPSNIISALFVHADGVWIGTAAGIAREQNGKLRILNKGNGLPDEAITALALDADGRLWAASSTGLFSINPAELRSFVAGRTTGVTARSFNSKDGVRSSSGRPFSGVQTDNQGGLWFLMQDGMLEVPRRNAGKPASFPVRLEEMVVDGNSIPLFPEHSSATIIPANSNRIEFRFTSLDLLRPERNAFRARLVGYDQQWRELGTQRSIDYTNLPGGDWRFEVAKSGDAAGDPAPAVVQFRKTLRFSESLWFPLSLMAAAAALVFLLFRWRSSRMQRRHQIVLAERQRIARELHDELLQGVNGAAMKLGALVLRNPDNPLRRSLDSIASDLESSVRDSREAVASLRGRRWEGVALGTALQEYGEKLCRPRGVLLECKELRAETSAHKTSPEVCELCWQIAREAIRNSLAHGNPGRIQIDLHQEAAVLLLQIKDDGCGFHPHEALQQPGHFGLRGALERAQVIGAKLDIQSAPGAGSCLTLRLPLV
jgi:signal transduction histidine kinase